MADIWKQVFWCSTLWIIMVEQNENKTKKNALTSPTMSSNSRSLSSSPPAEKEQKSMYRDCLFHAPRGDSERRVLYGCNPPDRLERTTIGGLQPISGDTDNSAAMYNCWWTNKRSSWAIFCFRPPTWRLWRNVRTTYTPWRKTEIAKRCIVACIKGDDE